VFPSAGFLQCPASHPSIHVASFPPITCRKWLPDRENGGFIYGLDRNTRRPKYVQG
jgi:hypothetical protein